MGGRCTVLTLGVLYSFFFLSLSGNGLAGELLLV